MGSGGHGGHGRGQLHGGHRPLFLAFTEAESCGKCAPCRAGTRQMRAILGRHSWPAQGQAADLDTLERLAQSVKSGSLCGLGQTAPNPLLTTLRYFRDEYEAHINGSCPALVCPSLLHYEIDIEKCMGCGLCGAPVRPGHQGRPGRGARHQPGKMHPVRPVRRGLPRQVRRREEDSGEDLVIRLRLGGSFR